MQEHRGRERFRECERKRERETESEVKKFCSVFWLFIQSEAIFVYKIQFVNKCQLKMKMKEKDHLVKLGN